MRVNNQPPPHLHGANYPTLEDHRTASHKGKEISTLLSMHNSILTSFVSQSWGVDLEGANFTWHLDTNSSLLQNSNLHTEEYNDTYKADNQQMYIG